MNEFGDYHAGLEPGAADYEERVIVKFNDDFQLPYDERAGDQLREFGDPIWQQLQDENPNLQLQPVFTSVTPDEIGRLVDDAQERSSSIGREYSPPNFLTFFYLGNVGDEDKEYLAKMLRESPLVQYAYVERPGPDPNVNPLSEPHWAIQRHLGAAPDGVNVQAAWAVPGGDGAGVRFVDIERGWTLDHEDLVGTNLRQLFGTIADDSRSHGTSVLGIVCARENGNGGVGLAPNPDQVSVASFYNLVRADALMAGVNALDAGDVLLVEAQVEIPWSSGSILAPVDFLPADWEVIHLATSRGIVVVEAGGNGTGNGHAPALDLDLITSLPDSGAIIVTAATSTAPHARLPFAPYGQRIDCYAWGENISTCSSNEDGATDRYRPRGNLAGFAGTSGAAAIIAGVVLCLQGMATARGQRLNPYELRDILRDPRNGTEPDPGETTRIGAMPDLEKIVANLGF